MIAEPNIIVGGGQAAARAAQSMREAGFAGPIILFGDETHLPYERPPLSKQYFFHGAEAGFKRVLSHQFYKDNNIDVHCGVRIEAIDRSARHVVAEDGSTFPFGRLLLATGSRLRRLTLAGADKPNVFYMRTLDDSAALLPRFAPGARVLIVGGGLIGLELASAAQYRGCEVCVIEAAPQILQRCVPPVVGTYIAQFHAGHAVNIKTGVYPMTFEGGKSVAAVGLSDGETLAVDTVVVGIGVIPTIDLAEKAGLAIDNGIIVDAFCATSDPNIFAAGDVANQFNPIVKCRLRQESWQNAQDQGFSAGTAMAGQPKEQATVPWAWSDQHDLNLQIAGIRLPGDDVVVRGSVESGCFTAFSINHGYLRGAVTINRGREMTLIKRLLRLGGAVDSAALGSESISLRDILSAASKNGVA